MSPSALRDTIIALFGTVEGDACSSLCIPRPLIAFCKGDVSAALFLSQLLYWSDRTKDEDGWIAKSYADWEIELGLSEYQVKRIINGDKRSRGGFMGLKLLGVEVTRRSSKHYGGAPALHYRINRAVFVANIQAFSAASKPNIVQVTITTKPNNVWFTHPNNVEVSPQSKPDIVQEQYTETTSTETTTTQTRARELETPTVPVKIMPVRSAVSWTSAINDVWGYNDWLNAETARMLQGVSADRGFQKFNVKPGLQSPAELLEWAAWYRKVKLGGKNLNMVEDRAKIQSSISEWRGESARIAEKQRRDRETADQYIGVPIAVNQFTEYARFRAASS